MNGNECKEIEFGNIPQEWDVVRIGDIADVLYGKANPKSIGTVPVIGSAGVFAWTDSPLVDYPTLVIGRKGNAGQVHLSQKPCYPSDTAFYFRWKQEICINFVYYCFLENRPSGESAKTTVPSLQRGDLENMTIPLPPLSEQKKIAAILWKIQQAIGVQEKIIEQTKEIKKALMAKMYMEGLHGEELKETEIGLMPKSWKIALLASCCSEIVDCPHSTPHFRSSGVRVARNFNIRDGRYLAEPSFYTNEEEYRQRIKRLEPQASDVLFSREAPVGEACLVPEDTRLSLGQRMMLLRTDRAKLDEMFLVYAFYVPTMRSRMFGMASGVTAPHLNVADVRKLALPIPNLAEQKEIAEVGRLLDRRLIVSEGMRDLQNAVFKSMLHQLMTGQIRVNNLEIPFIGERTGAVHVQA